MKSPTLLVLALSLAGCGGYGGYKLGALAAAPNADAYMAPAPMASVAGAPGEFNRESYKRIDENDFLSATRQPLSTFSVDVDTASYSNMRRFLAEGRLPPKDAIRTEELINYFEYGYQPPQGDVPIAMHTEVSECPWKSDHRLLRVGLKARTVADDELPPRNLVFLIDTSGSMDEPSKLPLVIQSLGLLAGQLNAQDRVSIVTYAGSSGLVLPPTPGDRPDVIRGSLGRLKGGGSTNGGEGLRLAYKVARETFRPQGINRVIIATDGDFNVGVTSEGELTRLIEEQRKSGVFLNVLGVGTGNYNDSSMEAIADKGNGVYAYLDSIREAQKVLVRQAGSNLVTVAKDVKLQIEFNPRLVSEYRLIGYENRVMKAEDFKDDKKDAGEMGAGHTVTALYEIVPPGAQPQSGAVDALKYQTETKASAASQAPELCTVKIRYKAPQGEESKELTFAVPDSTRSWKEASADFKFAASVASFGLVLRDSKHKGSASYSLVRGLAESGSQPDPGGYRTEFLGLVRKAESLSGTGPQRAR